MVGRQRMPLLAEENGPLVTGNEKEPGKTTGLNGCVLECQDKGR